MNLAMAVRKCTSSEADRTDVPLRAYCARTSALLSDDNRFAHGSLPSRLAKMVLDRAGPWGRVMAWRTAGRDYVIPEGDKVCFSCSDFDSHPRLAEWADCVEVGFGRASPLCPLLAADTILLAAQKQPNGAGEPAGVIA